MACSLSSAISSRDARVGSHNNSVCFVSTGECTCRITSEELQFTQREWFRRNSPLRRSLPRNTRNGDPLKSVLPFRVFLVFRGQKNGITDQAQDHLPDEGGLSFRTVSSPNSSVHGILCSIELPIGFGHREGCTKVAVGALLTLEIPSTANCLRIRWAPIHAI